MARPRIEAALSKAFSDRSRIAAGKFRFESGRRHAGRGSKPPNFA